MTVLVHISAHVKWLHQIGSFCALYTVSSGAVTVNEDSTVQILAEEAVPLSDLDIAAARSALDKAQAQLSSAGTEKAKAEASVAIEVYEALVKALEGN